MNQEFQDWVERTLGGIPSYACECCGYTNNDMFYHGREEATEADIAEFEMYKATYHWFNRKRQREQEAVIDKPRKSYTKKSDYWSKREEQNQ